MVEWKKLGEVCDRTSNIRWKNYTEDEFYEYIDLSSVSISKHKIEYTTKINKTTAPSRAQQIVCKDDILLGTTRPTLKRFCQIPSYLENSICSTGFCIFRANKKKVLSRWIFHNIGCDRFWDYCGQKQQGAGYPSLSNSDAFSYIIPIPPLSEQQRIVGILDTFTASIDNLKEQIAQRRKQYEYYRDQLLDLEGKEGVEMKTLGEIVSSNCSLSYGIVQPGDDVADGIPVVRPVDLISYNVYKEGLKKTKKEISDSYKRTILKGDEILLCVRGTTGITSLATKELVGCNVTRGIVPISFDDDTTKMFVYFQLKTNTLQKNIADKTNGTALKQINIKDLRLIKLAFPSLSEQHRIVSILDTFESSIRNLESQLSQREKQYEYYRNKLLTFE